MPTVRQYSRIIGTPSKTASTARTPATSFQFILRGIASPDKKLQEYQRRGKQQDAGWNKAATELHRVGEELASDLVKATHPKVEAGEQDGHLGEGNPLGPERLPGKLRRPKQIHSPAERVGNHRNDVRAVDHDERNAK